ncbi:helix-turn-helix domain-containing protein [Spirosoma sp. RP8]|uniref:Helix-turn-helix domain-containing protein n=1 Tax=Spirosoma liriopis TaxID=2937440 RepID=A0ABT0HNJ2_9BACT|nr:helix-turn-helix transcriptional regulator [Spirosoma liriopis]MCK8493130.1 helix-turn-helix domain-containing protein [Spirosoma liriopis]
MSEVTKKVGQLIRETRKLKGLTQKELGDKMGVSFQAINKYETGQNLTVETLSKIAQTLGVTITDLVKGL